MSPVVAALKVSHTFPCSPHTCRYTVIIILITSLSSSSSHHHRHHHHHHPISTASTVPFPLLPLSLPPLYFLTDTIAPPPTRLSPMLYNHCSTVPTHHLHPIPTTTSANSFTFTVQIRLSFFRNLCFLCFPFSHYFPRHNTVF